MGLELDEGTTRVLFCDLRGDCVVVDNAVKLSFHDLRRHHPHTFDPRLSLARHAGGEAELHVLAGELFRVRFRVLLSFVCCMLLTDESDVAEWLSAGGHWISLK